MLNNDIIRREVEREDETQDARWNLHEAELGMHMYVPCKPELGTLHVLSQTPRRSLHVFGVYEWENS